MKKKRWIEKGMKMETHEEKEKKYMLIQRINATIFNEEYQNVNTMK